MCAGEPTATEVKTKLCQLQLMRRKKALVRMTVGGCRDIPQGSSKMLSGMSLVLTMQPSCLYSAESLQLTYLPDKGDLFLASPVKEHGREPMLPLSWQIRND